MSEGWDKAHVVSLLRNLADRIEAGRLVYEFGALRFTREQSSYPGVMDLVAVESDLRLRVNDEERQRND